MKILRTFTTFRFEKSFSYFYVYCNTIHLIDDDKMKAMNLNYFDTVKLTGRMFTLIGNVSKPSLPQAHKRCSKVTPVCTRVNRHRGNAHTHTHGNAKTYVYTLDSRYTGNLTQVRMHVSRTRTPPSVIRINNQEHLTRQRITSRNICGTT